MGVAAVVPVVHGEDGVILGYEVVLGDDGRVVEVVGAGRYRRSGGRMAERLAGYESLAEGERRALAANTPPELIPLVLGRDDMRELAALVGVEKLRRDPLSLLELDGDRLGRLLRLAARYWREASPEANPAVIEMLIEELRGVAPEAVPELSYLYERLREEVEEEERVERMRRAQEEAFEEWERRLREEQTRARVRAAAGEVRRVLGEALGLQLPIILATGALTRPALRRVERGEAGEAEAELVSR